MKRSKSVCVKKTNMCIPTVYNNNRNNENAPSIVVQPDRSLLYRNTFDLCLSNRTIE